MTSFTIKLPDIGEGVAEVEIVEWNVSVGDFVKEDDTVVSVMSDKATVEIPSSVTGTVVETGANVGDSVAVGDILLVIETDRMPGADQHAEVTKSSNVEAEPEKTETVETPVVTAAPRTSAPLSAGGEKPLAAPSVRNRAREAGVDLRTICGTGPAGRITMSDLDARIESGMAPHSKNSLQPDNSVKEIKVAGLRRKIAQRMTLANQKIPHITIVEEVDMTDLDQLRKRMNEDKQGESEKLTLLPFIMRAVSVALKRQPMINAHYEDEEEIIRQFGAVHIGIATQTPSGLMVPVVRHCEASGLWALAGEMNRVCDRARKGEATREELSGSTITITSLGPLGALATTPIINHPEVAVIGINRMGIRPHWSGTEFVPRKMMNVSCSFDHRVIDGWDAAVFVQGLKNLLETPALIFVESSP